MYVSKEMVPYFEGFNFGHASWKFLNFYILFIIFDYNFLTFRCHLYHLYFVF